MSDPPVQSHGFQTSVDLAGQQTKSTSIAHAGLKRSHQTLISQSIALADTDQTPPAEAIAKRRSVDFARASSAAKNSRITASPIHSNPQSNNHHDASNLDSAMPPLALHTKTVISTNPLLSLQHPKYGLPPTLVSNFHAVGIHSIYPWQASCLLGHGTLSAEKNLLYTAPTGGGKSLVADVLMLKRVIENPHRKAILVLPYVALVQEKLKWLRRIVEDVEKNVHDNGPAFANQPWQQPSKEIRVTGFFGGSKSRASWADTDIAVCTIEKANSLVNASIEECNINDLAVVVVDEIHMLDDDSRGYLLELMISKLLLLQQDTQIIGMSATLSNTELLAEWLHASFHASNHRPIPIDEYLVYENAIYSSISSKEFFQTATKLQSASLHPAVTPWRQIEPSPFKELSNPISNAMVSLAVETATAGFGALVFCSSRQTCQLNAHLISEAIPLPSTLEAELLESRLDLLAELSSLPCGLDPVFQSTIIKGVGFHHAGLTTEERDLVADAYDRGTIKVIVATCSLAAGVNLPARRVIMQGARMGRDIVGPALLRQMRGRAGRKGKDTSGETYLICQKADLEAISEIWDAETPAIDSCLAQDSKALLEGIATRLVSGREAIDEFMRCTLLCRTREEAEIENLTNSSLQELIDTELICLRDDNSYEATKLGGAIVASSFSPDDGIFVYEELKRALQAFVMDGELHIFYMFTPFSVAMNTTIDWPIFRDQLDLLDESGIRAMQFVGVQPGLVNKMVQSGGDFKDNDPNDKMLSRIYRRAYTAFLLRDLSNEVPLSKIAHRYRVPRGVVQTLAQTCHGFAAGMVKFCQRMTGGNNGGWGMLAVVLDHMRDRLQAGARDDLLELAQVTHVKSWTARLLWENGFRSVRALAAADVKEVIPVLIMARSRKSQSSQAFENEAERYTAKIARKAEIIIASANKVYERLMQVEIDE